MKTKKRGKKMYTQIFTEVQGLIDLLKKEGKGASLRKELCEKMYDTVSTPVEILEEIDTDLELFSSENVRKLGFDIVLKIDHILFQIRDIPSIRLKTEVGKIPQVAGKVSLFIQIMSTQGYPH